MIKIHIKDENIKLGQALKLAGAVDSGVEAKIDIQDGLVYVNKEKCTQRGRKLFEGDVITYRNEEYVICNNNDSL